MNISRWCMMGLAVGLLVGVSVGGNIQGRNAIAQGNPAPVSTGRYQVSAFGTGGNIYGCYIVDTATGALWYSSPSHDAPKKISGNLP